MAKYFDFWERVFFSVDFFYRDTYKIDDSVENVEFFKNSYLTK